MTNRRTNRRRGATAVEAAFVLSAFLMLLFGMFEYCRFLLVLQVTTNAARDGARYASVNVNCQPTQVASTQTAIINYTKDRMAGVSKQLPDMKVAVYPVDAAGLAQSPPVVRSKSLNPPAYPDPFNPDSNTPPWNQVTFPDRLAVTVKGTYTPILPSFLFMPSALTINITAVMGSEG